MLAVAAAAAVFLSCAKESDVPDDAPVESEPVTVQKGRAIYFSAEDLDETRTGESSPVTSFGVFALGTSTGEEVMADQKVTLLSSGYTYSPVKYFPDGGIDLMAYAPYGTSSLSIPAGYGLPLSFTFSLPPGLDEDIVLAGPILGVEPDGSAIVLPFRHPLTRITVSFSLSPASQAIPPGKGIRTTSVSLSHCIRQGTFNAGDDLWSDRGELVSSGQECRVLVSSETAVEACSFYSVPFTAPEGASLHVEWEAFNLDSGVATRRYSTDVDLSGRDFHVSQNITASIVAVWNRDTIEFEDPEAEAACVAAFDTDGDGALSYLEAESVTDPGDAFTGNDRITLFNEFRYFTGITTLEGYYTGAFAYMSSLREITLPPNMTDVGGWPFCKCSSLEKIYVDESNTTYYSVDGCLYNSVTSSIVRVPESVAIESFVIPSGILTLGYGCFEGNTTITNLRIGKDVVTIEGEALKIYNLERITVDPASTTFTAPPCILYAIDGDENPVSLVLITPKGSLHSLILPDTITSVGKFAVFQNDGLSGITLNEGLESIGMCAFSEVSLGDIVIPSTVRSIGMYAFRYATLTSMTVLAENPPEMGEEAIPTGFPSTWDYYPIYVPPMSYQRYKEAPVWGSYSRLLPYFSP